VQVDSPGGNFSGKGHTSTTARRIKIGREFRNENSGKDVEVEYGKVGLPMQNSTR